MRVVIATSNPGKLRDFAGAAAEYSIEVAGLPGIDSLPAPVEDQPTFELNARKKAEHYSRLAPRELVLADDSGLEVDALDGAPGIYSARYAAMARNHGGNSSDSENNARLLRELENVSDDLRAARFVCVIAAARDGETIATFEGAARGVILRQPRGSGGFGYDPLFYFPSIDCTFAELPPQEKAHYSHRGQAFRKFLEWTKTRSEASRKP
jgi:XTP/dITP diphosphohydrolase